MKKIFVSIVLLGTFISIAWAGSDTQTLKAIDQRTKPVAQVDIQQASSNANSGATALSGKEIYEKYCTVCHTPGAAGAPKFGDAAGWKARIAQGKDVLYQHAIQGYKLMPPKGTCMTCSDDDIKKTVDYIVENSGGKK